MIKLNTHKLTGRDHPILGDYINSLRPWFFVKGRTYYVVGSDKPFILTGWDKPLTMPSGSYVSSALLSADGKTFRIHPAGLISKPEGDHGRG